MAMHLGSRQVARVTYGAIIGLALVVALQAHPPANRIVIGSLIGTAIAVALAEVYSELLGGESRLRRRPTREEVGEVVVDGMAVAGGVGFPAIFFILAAAGAIESDLAFNLAKWTGVGLIAFYGVLGGTAVGIDSPRRLGPGAGRGADRRGPDHAQSGSALTSAGTRTSAWHLACRRRTRTSRRSPSRAATRRSRTRRPCSAAGRRPRRTSGSPT